MRVVAKKRTITKARIKGVDCAVMTSTLVVQRRVRIGELSAHPTRQAISSVAVNDPMSNKNVQRTPVLKRVHPETVVSHGNEMSAPVNVEKNTSNSFTRSPNSVGLSIVSSSGNMQSGLVLPVERSQLSFFQTSLAISRNSVLMPLASAKSRSVPSRCIV